MSVSIVSVSIVSVDVEGKLWYNIHRL